MSGIWLAVRTAMRALMVNRLRAFLTMLGIIIGVSAVVIIVSLGEGAQSLITSSIAKVGTRIVSVSAGKTDGGGPPAAVMGLVIKTLNQRDADALKKIPHVESLDTLIQGTAVLTVGRQTDGVTYQGTSETYPLVQAHPIARGRYFTANEVRSVAPVVVLGASVAEEMFPRNQNPVGQSVKLKDTKMKVIGVLSVKGAQVFGSPDDQVFTPVTTVQKRLQNINYFQGIRVLVDDEDYIELTMERIRQVMRTQHRIKDPEDDDFDVRAIATALDLVRGITDGVKAFLALVSGVSLLVGGIGVMNIMLMNVRSRTREIGLRKALGATPSMIAQQFLTESLVMTIIGGVIGTLFGILVSFLVAFGAQSAGYEWTFAITWQSIALGVGLSAAVGILFGISPARKAAALEPINALRYE